MPSPATIGEPKYFHVFVRPSYGFDPGLGKEFHFTFEDGKQISGLVVATYKDYAGLDITFQETEYFAALPEAE